MDDLELLRGKRIGVLCGGESGEREVSFRSGRGMAEALRRHGFEVVQIDPRSPLLDQLQEAGVEVVCNALHGGAGEDGTIQAVLDYAGLPYTGSGMAACALSLDKLQTKRVLQAVGIPTPPWRVARRGEDAAAAAAQAVAALGLPVVLKPTHEGSSLGITIPKTGAELATDLAALLARYQQVLLEQFVRGTELTLGVVGVGERLRALPVLELVPHNEFYDYEAKYTKGLTDLIVPARISPPLAAAAQDVALRTHEALGCVGVSRVDMHLDEAGSLWVTELNSSPGMTETSDLPAEAAAGGMSYDDLVLEILRSALTRL